MVHERRICLTYGGRGRIVKNTRTSRCPACANAARPADPRAARFDHRPEHPDQASSDTP